MSNTELNLVILVTSSILLMSLSEVFADTDISADYIETHITHPDGVVRGDDFNISFHLKNSASTQRNNVSISLDFQPEVFSSDSELTFTLDTMAGYGEYGHTLHFESLPNATLGQHFINLQYSHIESDGDLRYYNSVLPIIIREEPKVLLKIKVQESIYAEAEFPFEVEIISQGSNLKDVTIQIIPPTEITFRGQTLHTFSSIDRDEPISLRADLVTGEQQQVGYEHYIPFQVNANYTDETDTPRSTSNTISVLLRPKSFFELGHEGGFWFGPIYFTPTIGIGTFVGIPGGMILFYKWYKKRFKKRTRK